MAQLKGGTYVGGDINVANDVYSRILRSSVPTGTPPLYVTSTTKVTNLNADMLEGYHADSAASANTIVQRDANGYINVVFINSNRGSENSAAAQYLYDTGDGWMRKKDVSNVRTELVTSSAITSGLGYTPLNRAGDVMSGNIGRSAHEVGFLVGGYNNVGDSAAKTNPIFTIGSSYLPTADALSNMYGIGYTYTAASFINATNLGAEPTGWGLYVAAAGTPKIFLDATDGNGIFKGNVYSNGSVLAKDSLVMHLAGNETVTGIKMFNTSSGVSVSNGGGDNCNLSAYGTGGGAAMMSFHRPGSYAVYFGLDTDNALKIGGWSLGGYSYKIWHQGNNLLQLGEVTPNNVDRTVYSSLQTGAGVTGQAALYSTIYTLGAVSGGNALQLSTDSDYNGSNLYFRQYNHNAASPGGVGWQSWAKAWTSLNDSPLAHLAGTETFTGSKTFNAGITIGDNQTITHSAISTRDKIRVWSGGAYSIGMGAGYTFGPIEDEYAMTFQMDDTPNRGWWWGHFNHTNAQGAAALSSAGKMTIASALRVGYGQTDTAAPASNVVDVSGGIKTTNGVNGCEMKYNSTSKTLDFIFS